MGKVCSCVIPRMVMQGTVLIPHKGLYVTGFAKRDHLGLRLDFELGMWSESTLMSFLLHFTALR